MFHMVMYFCMQLDRQVLSPDEKELPGAGTQASKQFSLIFCRQWVSIEVGEGGTR